LVETWFDKVGKAAAERGASDPERLDDGVDAPIAVK
jgi:hypothetical protein